LEMVIGKIDVGNYLSPEMFVKDIHPLSLVSAIWSFHLSPVYLPC